MASASKCNIKLDEIKEQFINFATNLTHNDCSNEDVNIDIKDLVWILQTVGFNITRIDSCDLCDVSLLQGGRKGLRVNVSCCHSGQRVILEKHTDDNGCNCKQATSDEATTPSTKSVVPSLVETGSDQIPPVSKEQKSLIKNTLNFFVDMLHDNLHIYKFPTIDTSLFKPRHNSTIDSKYSPDKVGSLDALVKSDINQNTYYLSSSSILDIKVGQQKSVSSPDLSRRTKHLPHHLLSEVSNKPSVNKLIKNAYDLLGDALNIMSNTNSTKSNSSLSSFGYNDLPFQRLQVNKASFSKRSLTATKPPLPKSRTTPSTPSSLLRKNAMFFRSTNTIVNKFKSAVTSRPERDSAFTKKTYKYANVKSTIPKPDPPMKKS